MLLCLFVWGSAIIHLVYAMQMADALLSLSYLAYTVETFLVGCPQQCTEQHNALSRCLEGLFDTWGTLGHGFNNNLTLGGPDPIGARKANLSYQAQTYMEEVALNEQVCFCSGHFHRSILSCGESSAAGMAQREDLCWLDC